VSASTAVAAHRDDESRAARVRRANIRLAVALGVVAAVLYVGFIVSGIT
jgi:hypothetical protein